MGTGRRLSLGLKGENWTNTGSSGGRPDGMGSYHGGLNGNFTRWESEIQKEIKGREGVLQNGDSADREVSDPHE